MSLVWEESRFSWVTEAEAGFMNQEERKPNPAAGATPALLPSSQDPRPHGANPVSASSALGILVTVQ